MTNQIPTTSPLVRDSNGNSIQIGSGFVTSDASDTQKESPFTLTGGVDAFVVPQNAVELIVGPSADIQVSELSDGSVYDVVAANTKESIPCARMSAVYITGGNGDTLNFRFTIV